MRESVHAKDDNDVHAVVRFYEITELVFGDDFFWDVGEFHPNVLWAFKWSVEVEVGNVHGHEACIGGGYYTVEENLGREHVGGGCGDLAWVVDPVPSHDEACAIGFFLFRSYGAYELTVRDVFEPVFGYVPLSDEAYGVGALYPAADAVSQAAKFVGRGFGPVVVVCWVSEERAVIEERASVLVQDR